MTNAHPNPRLRPVIRLFISSTFADFKAERDLLQRQVFPKLRQLCLSKGLRFQAIDLRWGVSEEAGKNNETMRICLRELKRCQESSIKPNFLVLLGDRYGWRPLPPAIRADLFEAITRRLTSEDTMATVLLDTWYRRDNNAVPAHYVLLPRTGRFEAFAVWESEVERPLLASLTRVAEAMRIDTDTPSPLCKVLEETAIGLSATHQEIIHGALEIDDPRLDHVHAFVRTIRYTAGQCPHKDFVDLLPDGTPHTWAVNQLGRIRHELETKLGRLNEPGSSLHGYTVKWNEMGAFTETDLEKFKQDVLVALTSVIEQQEKALISVPIEDQEEKAHRDFGLERRYGFIGRQAPLVRVASCLAAGTGHFLAVVGPAGSGKSAFMALAAEQARGAHPHVTLIERYIGVTPSSSDLITLLRAVVTAIRRRYPKYSPANPDTIDPQDKDVPMQVNPLIMAFQEALHRPQAETPLFLFIDALDQLSDLHQSRQLHWLPRILSDHVCLVVSAASPPLEKAAYAPQETDSALSDPSGLPPSTTDLWPALLARIPASDRITLEPLMARDGEQMLDCWLGKAGRTLQSAQREPLLKVFAVEGNPLWLRTATNEASRLPSWQLPPIWGSNTQELLEQVLERLSQEEEHGAMLVSRTFSYLNCARYGLSEDEMVDILSADKDVMDDFRRRSPNSPDVESLPVAVWVRLRGDIEPYLTEFTADATTLLTFYHRFLRDIVKTWFAGKATVETLHQKLAQYFSGRTDRTPFEIIEANAAWKPNLRRLSEYPYHLLHAGLWPALRTILANDGFYRAIHAADRDLDYFGLHDAALEAVKGTDNMALVFSFAFDRACIGARLDSDIEVQKRLGLAEVRNWQTPPDSETDSVDFTLIWVEPEAEAEFNSIREYLTSARSNGYALLRLTCQDSLAARDAFALQVSTLALVPDEDVRWKLVEDLLVTSASVIEPEYIAGVLEKCVQFIYALNPDAHHARMARLLRSTGANFSDLAAWHALTIKDKTLRASTALELACATAQDIAIPLLRDLLAQSLSVRISTSGEKDDALFRKGLSLLERLPALEGRELLAQCVAQLTNKPEHAAAVAAASWPVEGCTIPWCSTVWHALIEGLPTNAVEEVARTIWLKYRHERSVSRDHLAVAFHVLSGPLQNALARNPDIDEIVAAIAFLNELGLAADLDICYARVIDDLKNGVASTVRRSQIRTVGQALGKASVGITQRHVKTLIEGILAKGVQRDQVLSLLDLNWALSETASAATLAQIAELELTSLSQSKTGHDMMSDVAASVAAMAAAGATDNAEREESFQFACDIGLQIQDPEIRTAVRSTVLHCLRPTLLSRSILAKALQLMPSTDAASVPAILFGLELTDVSARAAFMVEAQDCWRRTCAMGRELTPPWGGFQVYAEDMEKNAAMAKAVAVAIEHPDLNREDCLLPWLQAWKKHPGQFDDEWARLGHSPNMKDTLAATPVAFDWQEVFSKKGSTWRERLACLRRVLYAAAGDRHLPMSVLTHIWVLERQGVAEMRNRKPWSAETRSICLKQVETLYRCMTTPNPEPWADLCTDGSPNWPYVQNETKVIVAVGVPDSCLFAFVMRDVPQIVWDVFVEDFLTVAGSLLIEAVNSDCLVALSYLMAVRKTRQPQRMEFLGLLRRTFTRPAIPAAILSWLYRCGHDGAMGALHHAVESRLRDENGALTAIPALMAVIEDPAYDEAAREFLRQAALAGSGDFAAEAAHQACRQRLSNNKENAGAWFSLAVDLLPMMVTGRKFVEILFALTRLAGLPGMPAESVTSLLKQAMSLPRCPERDKHDWATSKEKLRAGVLITACTAILERRNEPVARDWMYGLLEAAKAPVTRHTGGKKAALTSLEKAWGKDSKIDKADFVNQLSRLMPKVVHEYEALSEKEQRANAVEWFWESQLAFAAARAGREMAELYPDLTATADRVMAYGQEVATLSAKGCEDIAIYWSMETSLNVSSETAPARLISVLDRKASVPSSEAWRCLGLWPIVCRKFAPHAFTANRVLLNSVINEHSKQWGLHPILGTKYEPVDAFVTLGADQAANESSLLGSAIALDGKPDLLADWIIDTAPRMVLDPEGALRSILPRCALEVKNISLRLLQIIALTGGREVALAFARTWVAKNGEMERGIRRFLLKDAFCSAAKDDIDALLSRVAVYLSERSDDTLTSAESAAIRQELMSLVEVGPPMQKKHLMDAIRKAYTNKRKEAGS